MNMNPRVNRWVVWTALPALMLILAAGWNLRAAEDPVALPAPAKDAAKQAGAPQTAVLAGGCFWGVQGVFQHVKGVRSVLSGYAGGERSTADYETVSTGTTGHAESVQIVFDPAQVSYGEILRAYFSVAHDPTQLNRQGPDVGTQYRSSIFYLDEGQKQIAESYIAQLNQAHVFAKPIATKVAPLRQFYPAEGYHQDYLVNHPNQPYIVFNDLPKVANLKRLLPTMYQDAPVLVRSASR
jgi:peptide-methionine (S)-S-oxide reductase